MMGCHPSPAAGGDGTGAYRVYADPADLLAHLDEVGVRGIPD